MAISKERMRYLMIHVTPELRRYVDERGYKWHFLLANFPEGYLPFTAEAWWAFLAFLDKRRIRDALN